MEAWKEEYWKALKDEETEPWTIEEIVGNPNSQSSPIDKKQLKVNLIVLEEETGQKWEKLRPRSLTHTVLECRQP